MTSAGTAPYATTARQFSRQAKKLKNSAFAAPIECHAASTGANQNSIMTGAYRAASASAAASQSAASSSPGVPRPERAARSAPSESASASAAKISIEQAR